MPAPDPVSMTRLVYILWLLGALLLFAVALLLVLATLVVGLVIGLLGGFGLRHLLALLRRGG